MATSKNAPEPAKKAPAKKAPAKKAPAKKAPAAKKAAPAKKAPAKKAPAAKKAAPAKKAPARRAPATPRTEPTDPLAAALAAALDQRKPATSKARVTKQASSEAKRPTEKLAYVLAGAAVVVSLLAGGIVLAKRGGAGDRCADAVSALRSLIASQPDKTQLTTAQLEATVAEQENLQTYCQYNEANQVLQSEVIPWLGITPPTSLPAATTVAPTTTTGMQPTTTQG